MPRLELLDLKIYPRYEEGDDEATKAFRRVRIGLEYSGYVFRAIGSLALSRRANKDDPQSVNLWEHLRDADEELTALAKLGDACAAFAESEFEEFVKNYVDEPAKAAQNSEQLAA